MVLRMIVIEIRGGMLQNDLAGSLTNLMINWLHVLEYWTYPILDFGIWIADLEWCRLKVRLISLLLDHKSEIQNPNCDYISDNENGLPQTFH